MDTLYVLLYIFTGCVFGGGFVAIKNKMGDRKLRIEDEIIFYFTFITLWPAIVLVLPIAIAYGTKKLVHHVLYSKEERVEAVKRRLGSY